MDTRFKKGYIPWNKGKKTGISPWKGKKRDIKTSNLLKTLRCGKKDSKKTKFKKSLSKIGVKNNNWKGGISKIDKILRNMSEYKQWRSDVFERDNWTCQTCRISGVYVTAHHKKSFCSIIKENKINTVLDAKKCFELWDITNGVTLCEDCHKLTDNYKGRALKK